MSRSKRPVARPRSLEEAEALANAGDEFDRRLDALRATIEAKRAEGWNFTPRAPVDPIDRT